MKAEKPLPMKLNGKTLVLRRVAPVVTKIMVYLDTLPDDELLDKIELVQRRVASKDSICNAVQDTPDFARYCLRTDAGHSQKRYLFGNPRAIAALKKLIEAQS